ncbi:hypothetical protein SKAU_G00227750 [Synaphobranchus kaupii]|uniref:Uncharacterized protein n=1 Tax=Synaphobranchus kaupii TaxID=118154 RepID=A0A9Q1F5F3_SYNKA|nr:hypothetical protein SKAU_G00227750 [Synaphobranchus kaupii]
MSPVPHPAPAPLPPFPGKRCEVQRARSAVVRVPRLGQHQVPRVVSIGPPPHAPEVPQGQERDQAAPADGAQTRHGPASNWGQTSSFANVSSRTPAHKGEARHAPPRFLNTAPPIRGPPPLSSLAPVNTAHFPFPPGVLR